MDARMTGSNTSCGLVLLLLAVSSVGCRHPHTGAHYDRPFPLGAVSDVFWETQQTNAEAADFTFYDHEFRGDTAQLAPGAKRHLESVALRLEHVPFPVVIEQSRHDRNPELDQSRREMIVEQLTRMGVPNAAGRVVIAPAFVEGFTADEGAEAYFSLFGGFRGGVGRRGGGRGGFYR